MLSIRIFISSPGDVATERVRSDRVIRKLGVEFGGRVRLKPFFWEHEPMRATASFTDPQNIPLTSDFDIVVCILWSRLGTMLSDRFRRPDGSRYPSGTVFELETAHASYQRKHAPDLLVYRREQDISLPQDPKARSIKIEQLEALDAFITDWFFDKDSTFKSALNSYRTVAQFEGLLENHLRRLIQDRISTHLGADASNEPVEFATYHGGNPYRGLEPYRFEDRELFFGRAQAIEEVLTALRRQASLSHPLVIIHGMSGCGKSSLAKAGVLPLLMMPGVIENVAAWRRAEFRPGHSVQDPFLGLAKCLCLEPATALDPSGDSSMGSNAEAPGSIELDSLVALPELRRLGVTPEKLARLLAEDPEKVPVLIGQALHQVAINLQADESLPSLPVCRLVLLVDQLEEIFSDDNRFPADMRRRIDRAIAALVRSEQVWSLMTLRSDHMGRLAELENAAALTAQGGQVLLTPPSEADLSLMIRLPARAAGVLFEQDANGLRLEHRLLMEARHAPDGLPLLSFVLQALHEKMPQGSNRLTHAALDEMNGLEGAVSARAEESFVTFSDSLGADGTARSAAALQTLVRALTTLAEDPETPPLRRVSPLDTLQADPDTRGLVDTLIRARLLTTGANDAGKPTVQVTHEALFRKWPRLQDTIEQDRRFLECRRRAEVAATEWRTRNRKHEFLWDRGDRLKDARFLRSHGQALDGIAAEFCQKSVERSGKLRIMRGAAAVMALGAIPIVWSFVAKKTPSELTFEQKEDLERIDQAKDITALEEQLATLLKRLDDKLWPPVPGMLEPSAMEDRRIFLDTPLAGMRAGPKALGSSMAEAEEDEPAYPELEIREICRRLLALQPDHPQAFAAAVRADIAAAQRAQDSESAYADIANRLNQWTAMGQSRDELLDLNAQIAWNRGDKTQAAILWADYAQTPGITDPVKRRILERVTAIHIQMNKRREARLWLDSWIGWQDNALARARRSALSLAELRIQEAKVDFDRASELEPSLDELKPLAPKIERALHYLDDIERLTKIIENQSDSILPVSWLERAKTLLLAGQPAAALADIEQAARQGPKPSTLIAILRGMATVRSGGSPAADSGVTRLSAWNADDAAFAEYLEQHWADLLKLLAMDVVAADRPEFPNARYERGWLLWRKNQPKLAMIDAEALAKANPNAAEHQMLKIACLVGLGHYAEALQMADPLVLRHRRNAELHRFRAQALANLRRHDEALIAIETALGEAPRVWYFWEIKSRILSELQRPADAKAAAQKAVEYKESER